MAHRQAFRPRNQSSELTTLPELAERFAAFRGTHPRFARVPRELRAAAVAAVEAGVSGHALWRSCGVSNAQLRAWRAAIGGEDAVKVLSVVDEPGGATDDSSLELRLGRFAISVRLVAEDRGERR